MRKIYFLRNSAAILCFILFLAFLIYPLAAAQDASAVKVFEKDGNIYITDSKGEQLKLTDTGRDEEPALHPGEKWVYFMRLFEGEFVNGVYYPKKDKLPEDGVLKMELWRIDADGKNAKMLYRNTIAAIDHPSGYGYASIDNIQFSPSGDKVYFETSEYVTSNALNVMDPDGSNIKQLDQGNDTKIILSAYGKDDTEYRGYIVTSQHRYFVFGPSYDWYWLYTPEWKEIGPLGATLEDFTGNVGIKYTDGSEKELYKSSRE